jgi:FeS assembly SUF system protein
MSNDISSIDETAGNESVTNGTGTADKEPMSNGTVGNVPMSNESVSLRDKVEEVLHTIYDPEIPVNIFDLGLVYEVKIGDRGEVKITMTLTAPACPAAGEIIHEVQQKIEGLDGVLDCHVNLTFDPPWTKEMMTEEAKLELGFL